ncbi:MAG: SPFH domain-containing protein, partial [Pseudomonadota bacterium]
MSVIEEKRYRAVTGWLPLFVSLGLIGFSVFCFIAKVPLPAVISLIVAFIMFGGFMAIAPNDARVLLLFGAYKGSVTESGFFWVNPFYSKKKISCRVRNFETGSVNLPEKKNSSGAVVQEKSRSSGRPSKVNDRDGNPIEISAV